MGEVHIEPQMHEGTNACKKYKQNMYKSYEQMRHEVYVLSVHPDSASYRSLCVVFARSWRRNVFVRSHFG